MMGLDLSELMLGIYSRKLSYATVSPEYFTMILKNHKTGLAA